MGLIIFEPETYNQYTYPEGFQAILDDPRHNYWMDPIEYIGPSTLCYWRHSSDDRAGWIRHDPQHPRCGFCGKFVKAGDWWKYTYWGRTGPCMTCDEDKRWQVR